MEYLVNIGLEGGQCVSKTYRYYYELVIAVPGLESCRLFVSCFNSKTVVGIL